MHSFLKQPSVCECQQGQLLQQSHRIAMLLRLFETRTRVTAIIVIQGQFLICHISMYVILTRQNKTKTLHCALHGKDGRVEVAVPL